MIAPKQCRAARALLGWSQEKLAGEANVGLSTVRNFEKERSKPIANNISAMRMVLEAAGIQFVDENGGGIGVRLSRPSH